MQKNSPFSPPSRCLMMFGKIAATAVAAVLAVLAVTAQADAQAVKRLGQFADWEAFSYAGKTGAVCYATTQPKRSLGAPKGRGAAYLSVTHRPRDKSFGVLSAAAGVDLRKDGAAEVDIGGARFEMFASGDTAWARDDGAVLQAMAKGREMIVSTTPAKGAALSDTYSLMGFSQAMAEIGKACGVK